MTSTDQSDRVPARPTGRPDLSALFGASVLQAAVLLLVLTLYKKGGRSFGVFLPTTVGVVSVGALLLTAGSLVLIALRFRIRGRSGGLQCQLAVALSLMTGIASLLAGEIMVRILAKQGPFGPMIGIQELRPRDWQKVMVAHRADWARPARPGAYWVYDTLLGWAVGPSRASTDGLYFSSVEGLRSVRSGVVLRQPNRRRVALLGDSFTFGVEVRYQDTWGSRLDSLLGPDTQVLNFGVSAYGVDQAYLRYERDVRPWKPDVAVLAMIDHDLERTMSVYSFLTFGFDWPFAKPRFIRADGDLRLLNMPVIRLEDVAGAPAIDSLPYLAYDRQYDPAVWSDGWVKYSYLTRLVTSVFPRWPVPNGFTSDAEMQSLNGAIIRAFVDRARADGSVPIILYLPTRSYFTPSMAAYSGKEGSPALKLLRGSGLPYHDMTPCIEGLPLDRRFAKVHYSPEAHMTLAHCLYPVIAAALQQSSHSRETPPADTLRVQRP
jgi:hypothetical protein